MRRARHLFNHLIFWIGAICIGLVALLFAVGAEQANATMHWLLGISPLIPFVTLPLGLGLVAYLTQKFFAGSQGSGIPQAIAALDMEDESKKSAVLSIRIACGKIFLTLISLVAGASVGREGPTVQIGASIMHSLGRFIKSPYYDMHRGLLVAGGACGIAAAFNTPLAGVVFAIEEMTRSFEERTNGLVLTTVLLAGVTSLGIMGNYTYFGHTSAALDFGMGWFAVVVCGVVGGIVGGIFGRTIIGITLAMPGRLGVLRKSKPVLFAALCGLVLALIGLASGNTTFGTGYDEARHILEGHDSLPASYGILKLLATAVSYASGIPGGIFSPCLAIGAGMGDNLSALMPFAPAGAIVLMSMTAFFTGVVQTPFTAFVIVMEVTDNHTMVLPLMAVALIAETLSRLICPVPIYRALAEDFRAKDEKPWDEPEIEYEPESEPEPDSDTSGR
jgi:H+/Cl- antiporter ClcA